MKNFEDWVLNGGTIIGNDEIDVQAGGKSVDTQAGGNPSRYIKRTEKPEVHDTDIAIKDSGVAQTTIVDGIPVPRVHSGSEPHVNDYSNMVADVSTYVNTPTVNLSNIFGVRYNPQLTEKGINKDEAQDSYLNVADYLRAFKDYDLVSRTDLSIAADVLDQITEVELYESTGNIKRDIRNCMMLISKNRNKYIRKGVSRIDLITTENVLSTVL